MAAQAGLCLAWSETPEDTFCRVAARIKSHDDSFPIDGYHGILNKRCDQSLRQTESGRTVTITMNRKRSPGMDRRKPTNEPPHDKTNKMSVRPAKIQISLGIRPV